MSSKSERRPEIEEMEILMDSSETANSHLHRSQRSALMDHECLNMMFNDKLLCDVVLVAEDKEVPAHKLMLASSSAFFYWKFSKDRYLRALNRIEISNLTYETLSAVVRYLYECEILITEQNVGELSAAACLLALKDLQQACRAFLRSNLNISNCVRTGQIAKQSQYDDLVMIAHNYMLAQFSEFVKRDEFLKMDHEHVSDLIRDNSLCASDEEEVLDGVIRWVNYDLQNRKGHIYNLLNKVRFSLITQGNILQRLEAEKWLTSDPYYDKFMFQVFKRHITDSLSKSQQHRYSSKYLMVVGATDGLNLDVELYDLDKNVWLRRPQLPNIQLSVEAPTVILGTTIYIIDGMSLKFFNTSDPAQTEWLECCKLLEDKKYFGTVACNDMIYIMGGQSDTSYLSTVHRIDVSSGKCNQLASLLEAKYFVSSGVMQGNIYIVGGEKKISDSYMQVNSVECYQSDSDTWYSMPSMSLKRSDTGVTSLGDCLYVVGGWDGVKACREVEVFNTAQYSWKRLADMNVGRFNPGVIAVNGQLFVFGGYTNLNKTPITSAEVYDPMSNTWTMLSSSMNRGKGCVSVHLVDKAKIKH